MLEGRTPSDVSACDQTLTSYSTYGALLGIPTLECHHTLHVAFLCDQHKSGTFPRATSPL